MDYPLEFPKQFKPRVDAEMLTVRHRFLHDNQVEKRVAKVVSVFAEITCKQVENGKWQVDSAYSTPKDFVTELCEEEAGDIQALWIKDDLRCI
jgi:hypothetical protein